MDNFGQTFMRLLLSLAALFAGAASKATMKFNPVSTFRRFVIPDCRRNSRQNCFPIGSQWKLGHLQHERRWQRPGSTDTRRRFGRISGLVSQRKPHRFKSNRSGRFHIYIMKRTGKTAADHFRFRTMKTRAGLRTLPDCFSVQTHWKSQIFIMNSDGSDLHQLIDTIGKNGHPDWSRTGT
jgi:hypothetical protein